MLRKEDTVLKIDTKRIKQRKNANIFGNCTPISGWIRQGCNIIMSVFLPGMLKKEKYHVRRPDGTGKMTEKETLCVTGGTLWQNYPLQLQMTTDRL